MCAQFSSRLAGSVAVAAAVAMALGACSTTGPVQGAAAVAAEHAVPAGGRWVVDRTTRLRRLTIASGALIQAPADHEVTLTVNGVETPIRAGTYTGNVVLTVTRSILVQFQSLPVEHFRAAVYVDDGAYAPDHSVASAVVGGSVTDSAARNVSITSKAEDFNGILVTGNSTYAIVNPKISFTGNGGNDFSGFGAGIMSDGHARVTVDHADIRTQGAVRTAVFAGGHSDMTVNDSSIDVRNGVLPADYKFTIQVGRMMEVPWMLGLTGNVRATNLVGNATAHYNNDHIRAQGWGALSTDVAEHTRMYVRNSVIETVDSGYGSYSIGDSHNYFSHCTFNVADYALIIAAEGSGTFTDGTVVNSRRFGVMMHSGVGGGTLTIDKGSVFNTRSTAIQIKGRGTTVVVDDARLNPGNGVLLEAMENDDPFAAGAGPVVGVAGGAGGAPPGGAGSGGPGSGGAGTGAGGAPAGSAVTGGSGPAGAAAGTPGADSGAAAVNSNVDATFRNVTLRGDILQAMTVRGDMTVRLERARIAGAISTATTAPAGGHAPTAQTYRSIGAVANTLTATPGPHGLRVRLDPASRWTVERTSYLTALDLAAGATVAAPQGHTLVMSVNGVVTPIRAGHYSGQILLRVEG